MSFNVEGVDFTKEGDKIRIQIGDNLAFISNDGWISVITEMSHKPENAEQHKKAEEFHLG